MMLGQSLIGWCEQLVASLGYWGVLLITLTESVVLIVPSEVTLPLFGFAVGRGDMQLLPVMMIAVIAATISTIPLWMVGRRLGRVRLRAFAARWGRHVGLTPDTIDAALGWFTRFGGWAVIVCRMLPGLRLGICLSAGIAGMPLDRFLMTCLAGNLIWTLVLVSLGVLLGENYQAIAGILNPAFRIGLVLVILYVLWRLARRLLAHRRGPNVRPACESEGRAGPSVERVFPGRK